MLVPAFPPFPFGFLSMLLASKIRGAAWRSTSPVSVSPPHLSSVQAKTLYGSVGGELDERDADRAVHQSVAEIHCIASSSSPPCQKPDTIQFTAPGREQYCLMITNSLG
jgi:hypothetical protein